MSKISRFLAVPVACAVVIAVVVYLAAQLTPGTRSADMDVVQSQGTYNVEAHLPRQVSRQEPTALRLTVRDNSGLVDLGQDGVPIHVTVTDETLTDIASYSFDRSLQLTQLESGVYEFAHLFSQPGQYTLLIEINSPDTRDHHGPGLAEYVGRLQIPAETEQRSITAAARTTATDIASGYIATIDSPPLRAGVPGRISIAVRRSDGVPVQLLGDIDDWHVLSNPRLEYYVMNHQDQRISDAVHRITPEITLPASGRYALWVRMYTNAGSPETGPAVGEELTFTFVVEAQ